MVTDISVFPDDLIEEQKYGIVKQDVLNLFVYYLSFNLSSIFCDMTSIRNSIYMDIMVDHTVENWCQ